MRSFRFGPWLLSWFVLASPAAAANSGVPAGVDERSIDAKATIAIGPGFTGAWYDPQQSGHGLFLEVLSDNRLLAWWFAFTPDGTQQSWFGGVGTYSGNTATVPVNLTTGGRWIPNFDATKVVIIPWGTLNFTFSDCNSGRVDFASTYPGYASNHMDLTRLTLPGGLSCQSAPSGSATAAKGVWAGTTSADEAVLAIVLDDGTYYMLHSKPGTAIDAGVFQGTASAAGGTFSSLDAVDFPIAQATETAGFASAASVGGTYVPGSELQLTINGARTLSATYVSGSDHPPSLAAAAGTYSGISGHVSGRRLAHFNIDTSGNLTGANDVCGFTGTVIPRQSVSVFDWTLRGTNNNCIFGGATLSGVMYYDEATRQIHGFAPYGLREDQYYLIGTK
jgi:hypothetical protein